MSIRCFLFLLAALFCGSFARADQDLELENSMRDVLRSEGEFNSRPNPPLKAASELSAEDDLQHAIEYHERLLDSEAPNTPEQRETKEKYAPVLNRLKRMQQEIRGKQGRPDP